MKIKINLIVLIILSITIVSSCKKDDNSSNNNSNISQIITSGSWQVSYYHESGNDHTSNFNGYSFTFNSNGTMTATNSSGTTNGTWRIDDSNSNELKISIGSSAPLSDLNKGWLVISKSDTEINLKDDDSTHNEELHLTKI